MAVPNTFTSGTVISAAQMNENFAAVPTSADLASTATGKGAALIGAQGGATLNDLVVPAYKPLGVSNEATALNAAAAIAASNSMPVTLAAGTALVSSQVSVTATGGIVGFGPERSKITASHTDAPILRVGNGQNQKISGVSTEYATLPTDANAACLYIEGNLQFSELSNLRLTSGYYGIYAAGVSGISEFNNSWSNVRIRNWVHSAIFLNDGSGSSRINHYMSAVGVPSVLRAITVNNANGEWLRLNIERSTIIDAVYYGIIDHNVSFLGLNMEGITLTSRGFYDGVNSVSGAIFRRTGQGTGLAQTFFIDSCHFGAHMVDYQLGLVNTSGTTWRAYINNMGMQQKVASGLGINVGYRVYIEGGSEAPFHGNSYTVTAAGKDGSGNDYIEFTVAGVWTTPAPIASGADCITVSIGDQLNFCQPIVHLDGNSQEFAIDGLHLRDNRTIGATSSRRKNMLRALKLSAGMAGRVRIRRISTMGQRSAYSHFTEQQRVRGYSVSAGVATVTFANVHNLRADSPIHIIGAAKADLNGRIATTLTIVDRFTISFATAATDTTGALYVRDSAARVLLGTYSITNVERASGYATITTSAAHGLFGGDPSGVGLRVCIACSDTTYSTPTGDDALIVAVPSTTTFVVRDTDADSGSAAATGTVMLIEAGLASEAITEGSGSGDVIEYGEFEEYCTIVAVAALAAGGTVTNSDAVPGRYVVGRHRWSLVSYTVLSGSGSFAVSGTVSGTTQHQVTVANIGTGAATAVLKIRYRIDRS